MNAIEDMRERLSERFRSGLKPQGGYRLQPAPNKATTPPKASFRPTANDMPRLPQSRIPNPKPQYDRAGRPSKESKPAPPLYREKPKSIFGGWL